MCEFEDVPAGDPGRPAWVAGGEWVFSSGPVETALVPNRFARWVQEVTDQGADMNEVMSNVTTVWDYLCNDPEWELDGNRDYGAAIVFGSDDIGTATVIEPFLNQRGLTEIPVVFTGYQGEAAKFAAHAVQRGLDPGRVILEEYAQQTGENVTKSIDLLRSRGYDTTTVVAGCAPHHARRVHETFAFAYGDVNVAISALKLPFANYVRYGRGHLEGHPGVADKVVQAVLGEMQRLIEYPGEGKLQAREIPGAVLAPYGELTKLFTPSVRRF